MIVKATENAEYPAGVRWTVGKVRDITLADGEKLPKWLVQVKPSKKPKAKKHQPAKTDEG
jgi:hypothetical protein